MSKEKYLIEQVKYFYEQNPPPAPLTIENTMMDVVSEAGEVVKEYQISTQWGTKPLTEFERECPECCTDLDDMRQEYGDLLFNVLALGLKLGISTDYELKRTLRNTVDKFEARIKLRGHMGSGDYVTVANRLVDSPITDL